MRPLVWLTFSLYLCTVVQGADVVSPEVYHGYEDQFSNSKVVTELREMKSILKDQKDLLVELKKQGEMVNNKCSTEIQYQLNELKSTVADQKVKLEELQKQLADKPHIAFSASIIGHGNQTVEGNSTERILKFQKVFTNVGDAYSPTTGKFTAPVKGVYYFGFSAFADRSYALGLHLRKNGQAVKAASDYSVSGTDVNGSNRAVLMLEKGDEVYLGLLINLHIFNNINRVSTFSGFLIFPM